MAAPLLCWELYGEERGAWEESTKIPKAQGTTEQRSSVWRGGEGWAAAARPAGTAWGMGRRDDPRLFTGTLTWCEGRRSVPSREVDDAVLLLPLLYPAGEPLRLQASGDKIPAIKPQKRGNVFVKAGRRRARWPLGKHYHRWTIRLAQSPSEAAIPPPRPLRSLSGTRGTFLL
ncbi:hypothetical protein E2C01_043889 [Portunus trituberculatus]|uniref:Uncharacterized protein n=1 Tax=Portunus trituberculatus TaxID=210409 RepID=A0A5B7FWW1_PORTR|nr:hypothetical protein [Portunus trituberculatus]